MQGVWYCGGYDNPRTEGFGRCYLREGSGHVVVIGVQLDSVLIPAIDWRCEDLRREVSLMVAWVCEVIVYSVSRLF